MKYTNFLTFYSQNLMGSRTPLKKSMGSAEPIEPMLTAPLYLNELYIDKKRHTIKKKVYW